MLLSYDSDIINSITIILNTIPKNYCIEFFKKCQRVKNRIK